ncbi:hypothetical protein Tco_0788885 [Tanacetum coccineum]
MSFTQIDVDTVRGIRPREGNDEHADDLNGQGNDQGLRANGGVEGVNGNVEGVNRGVKGAPDFSMIITQQMQNLLPAMLAQVGNTKRKNVGNKMEYDGNGGAIVLTQWIKKMESVQDMSGCSVDQKVKYTAGFSSMISGALTDEAVRNGSIKKVEKRRSVGEPSKDKNGRDDISRTRDENAFATTANPVGGENTGPKENRTNQVAANNGGQVRGNQVNQARGRAFMLGAEEAHQDSNIVTEPNELGFKYETEIASGQLVEIDKQRASNSLYVLAPSDIGGVVGKLKELQDVRFHSTSSSP